MEDVPCTCNEIKLGELHILSRAYGNLILHFIMACQVVKHGLLFMGFSNRLDRKGERGQSHDFSEKRAKGRVGQG